MTDFLHSILTFQLTFVYLPNLHCPRLHKNYKIRLYTRYVTVISHHRTVLVREVHFFFDYYHAVLEFYQKKQVCQIFLPLRQS
jgi:hypothetical protein